MGIIVAYFTTPKFTPALKTFTNILETDLCKFTGSHSISRNLVAHFVQF